MKRENVFIFFFSKKKYLTATAVVRVRGVKYYVTPYAVLRRVNDFMYLLLTYIVFVQTRETR